jgi:hypothetical protein
MAYRRQYNDRRQITNDDEYEYHENKPPLGFNPSLIVSGMMTRNTRSRTGSQVSATATSDDVCSMCSAKVDNKQNYIACDLCQMLCHQKCPGSDHVNFTDSIFLAVKENPGLAYLCPSCEGSKTKVFELYRDFDRFKTEIRKEFEELKASLVSDLADRRPAAPTAPAIQPSASAATIQEEVREALEKEKKKLSAVIVGLPEIDIGGIRCEGDMKFVKDIAFKLKIDSAEIKDVFRDGKIRDAEGGRVFCRIVKVKFDSWSAKMTFLRGFKKSIPGDLRAYVRHDLTFRERQEERALKSQLVKYREEFKDAEIVIYRGRIVYKDSKQVFSPSFHNLQLLAPGSYPPGGLGLAAAASQGR